VPFSFPLKHPKQEQVIYMCKIIIIFIPKIEPSNMSSLPISMEEEPQCVLQLFLPSATWLKIKLKALQSSVKVEHVEEKESS
jgi:hypothetical protein